MNGYVNAGAVAGQRFVDRVVDDLVNEVVQTALACGADVHPRALADCFQSLEHLDLSGGVIAPFVLRHKPRLVVLEKRRGKLWFCKYPAGLGGLHENDCAGTPSSPLIRPASGTGFC